jgi:hypothetical protein
MSYHLTPVMLGSVASERTVTAVAGGKESACLAAQLGNGSLLSMQTWLCGSPRNAIATHWRNQMKRRQTQRLPAEHDCSAARTPRLLHQIRDAANYVRWAGRRRDAATDTLAAIEEQLRTLQPICSAQRVSSGSTCGAPAVAVAEIHAVDGCDQMGLGPFGDLVETLCRACLTTVRTAMAAYVRDKREVASRCGNPPVCSTCERPIRYLHSVFAVRATGPEGSEP